MRTPNILAALAAVLLSACTALAQQTTPPASPDSSTARPGHGPGMGGGPGMRGGPGPRTGPDYTPGWGMMTPQERDAHHKRMSNSKNAQECRQAMDEHVKLMNERARQRGAGPMPGPRHDACAGVQG
jgi:hypothetical protein